VHTVAGIAAPQVCSEAAGSEKLEMHPCRMYDIISDLITCRERGSVLDSLSPAAPVAQGILGQLRLFSELPSHTVRL